MMTTDEFYLDESKEALIRQYKERISQVFNVDITFYKNDEKRGGTGVESCTKICLSSVYAQENIEEAKNYITSLVAEGEDFSKCIQTFPGEVVVMVQENKNVIEKKSQAVVDVLRDSQQICIFGQVKNVDRAQSLIKEMVHQDSSDISISDIRTRGGVDKNLTQNGLFCLSQTQSMDDSDGNSRKNRGRNFIKCDTDHHSSSNDILQMCDDDENNSEQTNCGEELNKTTFKTSPCPTPFAQEYNDSDLVLNSDGDVEVASLDQLNFSSHMSSSASSEDEIEKVETDPEYSTKIEFAIKLGYSEVQLARVLQKLGPNAGQNEILSELIKLGTLTSDDGQTSSDENLVYPIDGDSSNSVDRTSPVPDVTLKKLDTSKDLESNLRPIVLDGSNVAMSHGNKEIFSCRGIQLAVDWFRERGHMLITVFVPQWRKETSRPDSKIKDQEILVQLEREKVLVFTPARRIGGKRVVCYDDRYILNLAVENGGIVVSNDNYRDLVNEKAEYKKVVEERLLMYSFVNDRFMPPDDPLGRHGPSLDNFLCREPRQPEFLPPPCPYGSKKCTYGNKCKFYHPERGSVPQKSVTDKLAEHARQKIQEVRDRGPKSVDAERKKQLLSKKPVHGKMALQRTQSLVTSSLPLNLISDQPQLGQGGDVSAFCTDDAPKIHEMKDHGKEEKLKQYNDKLSEFRKRVEQAEMEEIQRKEEENIPTAGHSGFPDQMSLNLRSEQSSSRSLSPLQRSTPSPQLKPQEQFLSGHLMLAKKLSDEAGESKHHKMVEERKFTKSPPGNVYTMSPLAITQPHQPAVQQHKPLMQHQSLTLQQHKNPHSLVSQQHSQPLLQQTHQLAPNRHQKLSRQFSLQGNQDPRLKPCLQSQVSCDPRLLPSQYPPHYQQQYGRGLYGSSSRNQQKYHSQAGRSSSYHLEQQQFSNAPAQFGARASQGCFVGPNVNEFSSPTHKLTLEHTAVSRMQSAPEVPQMRNVETTQRNIGRMVRQNSSSDTQLHLIGDGDQGQVDYCLFPGGFMEKGLSDDSFSSHDNAFIYNRPSEGHRIQSKTMSGSGSSQEYRSQHQSGETRWTFDPVFDPGANVSFIQPPKQGVDALESDFPSLDLRQRGGSSWHQDQMPASSSAQSEYASHFQPQDQYAMNANTNVHGKRMLSRYNSNKEMSNPCGFVGQTSDICDDTSNSPYASMPFTRQTNPSALGYIGQEQRSVKKSSPPLMSHEQLMDSGVGGGGSMEPRGIPILGANAVKREIPDDAPIHPTDKRYSIYYHLCGLFKESTVRVVMNRHPEEMNPQELCAYIIGAK